MSSYVRVSVVAIAFGLIGHSHISGRGVPSAWTRLTYPPAKTVDATDVFHGTRVPDPYRSLEDSASPETRSWLAREEQLTASFLGAEPSRASLRHRLEQLTAYDTYSIPIKAAGRYFFSRVDKGADLDTRMLFVQDQRTGQAMSLWREKPALPAGSQITSFAPSPDGHFVAYSISHRQSRSMSVRVVDVTTGRDLADAIEGLNAVTAGISWTSDSHGFYYTKFDSTNATDGTAGTPVITHHEISTASTTDIALVGLPSSSTTLLTHRVTQDGQYLIASVRSGSANNELYCKPLAPPADWIRLTPAADATYTFLGNRGRYVWLYTTRSAGRGRVVAFDVAKPSPSNWTTVIGEKPDAIAALDQTGGGNALGLFGDRLVLNYLHDGRPVLRVFSMSGQLEREIRPAAGDFPWGGLRGRQDDPEVLYSVLGLTDPSSTYRLDVRTGRTSVFRRAEIPFDRRAIEVEQVFYQSHDGTRVPMFVAHKKGTVLNGDNPTYLYGYGGLGWVSFIWYQPHILAWLERGGVYAQPSLRGGGEYGEAWHQAGIKRNKQNTVDDYLAAAEWLINHRYTSPRQLVANGGSFSAPLAATAALVQRRDLFAAAIIDRPVLDLIRFEKFSGGGYWRPEFGSPGDAADFRVLFAQSPYHQVQRAACYPPTLVMSGELDQTAVPAHAYKFTAGLQAAQQCDNPILLKNMHGAGHNFGNSPEQVVDSFTDELSFLFRVLGKLSKQSTAGPRPRLPVSWTAVPSSTDIR